MAKVTGVDTVERKVKCVRPLGEEFDLAYDHLIVAAGVELSYFGHDEYAEWAPGMKTISDARGQAAARDLRADGRAGRSVTRA